MAKQPSVNPNARKVGQTAGAVAEYATDKTLKLGALGLRTLGASLVLFAKAATAAGERAKAIRA
jgi:hypothetical protein